MDHGRTRSRILSIYIVTCLLHIMPTYLSLEQKNYACHEYKVQVFFAKNVQPYKICFINYKTADFHFHYVYKTY